MNKDLNDKGKDKDKQQLAFLTKKSTNDNGAGSIESHSDGGYRSK